MCTRAPARTSVCDPPIRVECSRLWRLDPLTRVTLLENCAICCVRYGLLSLWRITRDTFLCPFHTYLFRGFECATPLVDNDICISYLLSFFRSCKLYSCYYIFRTYFSSVWLFMCHLYVKVGLFSVPVVDFSWQQCGSECFKTGACWIRSTCIVWWHDSCRKWLWLTDDKDVELTFLQFGVNITRTFRTTTCFYRNFL